MRWPRFFFFFLLLFGASQSQAQNLDLVARLQADVQSLTAFPSRVPGTPGNAAAAALVEARFRQIGLQSVRADRDFVTAPVTQSASVEVGGQTLPLLPIYPNHVVASTTPVAGLSGRLIYARTGLPADFNGKEVEGAIVLLDFNSGMNWITAADLGAQAIIFLEPTTAGRAQAERKFTYLPVEMPRFYAVGNTAAQLRRFADDGGAMGQAKGEATVKSQVIWKRVPVDNVLGFLPGKAAPAAGKKNTVIISAYYDSMSVVPDLAPGAEAAGNLAAMLELARRLQADPPAYNVLFVAEGAHHLALAGIRNFIANHVIDRDGKAGEAKLAEIGSYRAFIGLDLTSRTRTVGLFAKGWFYNQMTIGAENVLLNQFASLAKSVGVYAQEAADKRGAPIEAGFVDGITGREGRTWRSYLPAPIAFDSEAATMAALPGISFATANDARLLQDTPFDLPASLNFANLSSQVDAVEGLMRRTLSDVADADAKAAPLLPDSLSKNFGFLTGRAIFRDVGQASSFLPDSPLPDEQIGNAGVQAVGALVTDRTLPATVESKSYAGVRGVMIERARYSLAKAGTNAVSQFVFSGPRVGDPKGGGTPNYEFEAFSINRDGHLIFAPDRGAERQRFSPLFLKATPIVSYKDEPLRQFNVDASLICFPSRAVTIYDSLDQRYFSVLKEMSILDAKTDASPVEYSFLRPNAPAQSAEIEPVAVVFGKKGERFKLIMAAGLLGKRLVLLRTDTPDKPGQPISYEGLGFTVEDAAGANRIAHVAYQTALDLWTLNQQRIRLLKSFGINNERVDTLHGEAGCATGSTPSGFDCPKTGVAAPNGGSLQLAAEALQAKQYDTFYREARRAFGLESRAYPDVEGTSQDVLKGIVFYLALLLPFAYFLERILFGSPDVRKQIVGTSLIFLAVFTAIRFVHPAFELASTPFIILLAFIILALTLIVTAFLQSKFEQELKKMKQGIHFADMGRLSALGAAMGLGIANMRRRPTRTALTCVTLILLTFTVLSFTSVTANIANFARPYGDGRPAPYQGFLIRQPDWSALSEVAVTSIRNEITAKKLGEPALRAWYLSRDQGEPLQLRVNNAAAPDDFYYAPALLGLSPQESVIGSPITKTLLAGGRWFEEGDSDVCILPRDVLLDAAQRRAETPPVEGAQSPAAPSAEEEEKGSALGLTLENAVGSSVQIGGKTLRVIGVFDDRKWYGPQSEGNLRDIDGEEYTPVDYGSDANRQNQQAGTNAAASGNEVQVQRYEHMRANALLLLPYQTALDMGATTRSVAVGIEGATAVSDELNDLMQRAALGIFGATPDPKNGGQLTSKLYSSVEATSYEGFASLAIPIVIAALIIANTMLGSVYERTREIGIYSSIGLAPVHVATLFIAEAIVYAVLGSIAGYLIAQTTAKIITALGVLPGITLNYSSSSAILATLIVMLTVLLSTLYPAYAASKLANPDADRKNLGEPVGDLWRLQFPFTVSGLQSLGMAEFLADFFETHTDTSVGKFYTDKVHLNGLSLRDAVNLLNEGVLSPEAAAQLPNGQNGARKWTLKKKAAEAETETAETETAATETPIAAPKGGLIDLQSIAADPQTEVYRLSMRTWLAPFDMGVSQDTDIVLLPSQEPGLYELQLRLERRSGEISAWKRVNREFMTELRKQLLVWRTVKPEAQREFIMRGRAHISPAVEVESEELVGV